MATVIRQLDDEQLERPFNKKLFRRLLKYMQPYKKQVFMALGLMSAATVAALANTYLMSRAVGYLQNKDFTAVPFVLLGMVAASVTAMLCTRKRIRLMDTSGRRAIAKLREDLFKHIQGQSFSFFDTRSAGKLLVRVINDVNSLNDLFSNGIVNVLIECLTLVLLVGIMLAISWKLTLVALCILPVLALSVFKLKRMIRVRWLTNSIKSSTMNGYLHETLSGMRITQAFTREEFNSKTFRTVNNEVKRSWIKAVQLSTAFGPTLDLVGSIGTVLVYIFGVKFIRADTLAL
ncbi:MAG: ABC transporter ATP-binding protein, partial [Clostridia bacterium]|nr:ABC transporter ATP-binding protein [Clostridia bacterium]